MQRTGLSVAVHDASDQDETPASNWTVCFEKATLSKVDFAAVPHGAPCPKKDGGRIPWPKMLNVEGTTYARAVEKLGDRAGDVAIVAAYEDEIAYDADNRSGDYANWKVCFQSIKAGKPLEAEPGIILHAVKTGMPAHRPRGSTRTPPMTLTMSPLTPAPKLNPTLDGPKTTTAAVEEVVAARRMTTRATRVDAHRAAATTPARPEAAGRDHNDRAVSVSVSFSPVHGHSGETRNL